MGRPLGIKQLELLSCLGSPSRAMIVPDRITTSLARLGFVRTEADGSFARITPDGLRKLAMELEAGRIPDPVAVAKEPRS